jgi:hypothetical protein
MRRLDARQPSASNILTQSRRKHPCGRLFSFSLDLPIKTAAFFDNGRSCPAYPSVAKRLVRPKAGEIAPAYVNLSS